MKFWVLVVAVFLSLMLGAVNNSVSKKSIAWIGSPEVMEKPPGWPSEGMGKGVAAGLKTAWKLYHSHQVPVFIVLAVLLVASIYLRSRSAPISPLWRSALRIGLGWMFLAAAWPKFQNPEGFSLAVAQYQLLPAFAVNAFSILMPAAEIVIGLGLILTAWEREFTVLIGLLMLMFIVALGQALYRDLGIACGCFDIEGAASAGETWFSLLRDLVLMIPIAWMVVAGRKRFVWQLR